MSDTQGVSVNLNAALDQMSTMAGQATRTIAILQAVIVDRDATIAERDATIAELKATSPSPTPGGTP